MQHPTADTVHVGEYYNNIVKLNGRLVNVNYTGKDRLVTMKLLIIITLKLFVSLRYLNKQQMFISKGLGH